VPLGGPVRDPMRMPA